MFSKKTIYLGISATCVGLLGVGLYLQFYQDMLPCPFCVMQRYAFIGVAIFSLIAAFTQSRVSLVSKILAVGSAVTGMSLAGRQLYIIAYPKMSCGIDPYENALNSFFLSDWFPWLLKSNGLCETPYDPILGLSIPMWALVFFSGFALTHLALLFKRVR